jgi:uncharacterized membrane protein
MSRDAKGTATRHMCLNLLAVVIFAIAFWLRYGNNTSSIGITLTVIGVLVLAVSGWLGGRLTFHHGVGSDENARRTTLS